VPLVSVVMPTVGVAPDFERCARRVLECLDGATTAAEYVVVIDGPAIAKPSWLERPDVKVVSTGVRSGPGKARNAGVERSRGSILFFVDADVELAPDALDRVAATFAADPDLAGLLGSYDDEPADPGIVSRFRNLLHHHTHHAHPGQASTFWAGCGAMRVDVFRRVGGFDAAFRRPSIEDIELGVRVAASGGRLRIDPGLQGKHLKRWTLRSMVRTDILQRAVPWTRLMLSRREIPTTLNVDRRSRACGALSLATIAGLAFAPAFPFAWALSVACLLAIAMLQRDFLRLCLRKGGFGFATASWLLQSLYFAYSTLTFATVVAWEKSAARGRLMSTTLPCVLAVLLAALAVKDCGRAIWKSWRPEAVFDLRLRLAEYEAFRDGVYPNRAVEQSFVGGVRREGEPDSARPWDEVPFSPYPPYAVPMFVPFFEPGGLLQGRIVVQALSISSLVAMGLFGYRRLRPFGPAWAAVGGVAGAAIYTNPLSFMYGQFSILCAGLLIIQLMLLEQGRRSAAGLAWAFAMIKPHIAAAFAAVFLINRQSRGLITGAAFLMMLAGVACWWTETSPFAHARFLLLRAGLGFAADSSGVGLGKLTEWLGWNHRVTQLVAVAAAIAVAGLAASLARRLHRRMTVADLLPLAAVCAVLGRVLLYHRQYDNVMMFPLLVAWLSTALARPTAANVSMATAVAITLWLPWSQRIIELNPLVDSIAVIAPLIWVAAGVHLAVVTRLGLGAAESTNGASTHPCALASRSA